MSWIHQLTGPGLRSRLTRAAIAGLAIGTFFAPTFGLAPPLLVCNTGASQPLGLYLLQRRPPVRRGEIVVLRDPPHFELPWLMKTVAGVAGDRYCWDAAIRTQRLNGQPMPPPAPEATALRIPIWRGCRVLAADEVVGYGRSRDSYDSRYFGPVREERLWGVYRPLWVEP